MSLSLEFEDQLALVSGADISNVLISHKGSENGYMCVEMETPTNPQHMKLLAVRLVSRGDAFKVKEVIGVGKSTRVTVELGRTSVADAVVHFWCLFGKKKKWTSFHLQDASDELVTRLTTQAGQATLAEPPEGYPDIELCLNVTTNTDLKQSSLVLFMQALHPRNLSLKTSPRCPPLVDPSFLMSASVQRLTMLHLDVVPPIVTEENFKQLPQSRLNLGKQAATPLSATTLNRVLRDIQEGSAAEGASLLSRHLLELHLALADDVDWGVVVDGLNANVEPLDRGVSFSCAGGRRCVVSFDVDVDGMTLLHVGVILPEQPGHAHTYRVPDNCPVQ